MGEKYYLSVGPEKRRYFSLPPKWTAVHFLESAHAAAAQSVQEMTREALAKPVGIPRLREMVSGGKRVAVIVDDGTRPTPASEILAVLLPHLIEAGCPKEATTIVIALGTHAPMKRRSLPASWARRSPLRTKWFSTMPGRPTSFPCRYRGTNGR